METAAKRTELTRIDARKDPDSSVLTVTSADLFAGVREVVIDHEGQRYRLRITRNGKLIMNK